MTTRETLLNWLNDAHAMEKGLIEVLENHAQDAEDYPNIKAKIEQHLEKTRRHADLVEECIQRLGGDISALKTAVGKLSGWFQGRSTGAAGDELVKNAISDYAAEHFEIASYEALVAAAEALGEEVVARVCLEILADEKEMAHWLEQNLPGTIQEHLQQQASR
jgi:ferritin-like metal-binding protein YciE